MNLVWKLMRRHISLGQLAGFFLANLCGMVIVLHREQEGEYARLDGGQEQSVLIRGN